MISQVPVVAVEVILVIYAITVDIHDNDHDGMIFYTMLYATCLFYDKLVRS